jgi:hypothetical protein
MMPLLSTMRDESEDKSERLDAAKAAAPYCHARLSSTGVSGPNQGPMQLEHIEGDRRNAGLGSISRQGDGEALDWGYGGTHGGLSRPKGFPANYHRTTLLADLFIKTS